MHPDAVQPVARPRGVAAIAGLPIVVAALGLLALLAPRGPRRNRFIGSVRCSPLGVASRFSTAFAERTSPPFAVPWRPASSAS